MKCGRNAGAEFLVLLDQTDDGILSGRLRRSSVTVFVAVSLIRFPSFSSSSQTNRFRFEMGLAPTDGLIRPKYPRAGNTPFKNDFCNKIGP